MRYLTLTLAILVFTACSNTKTVEVVTDFGKEKYIADKNTGVKNGPFERYNENGVLTEKGNYLNDTIHGANEMYAEDGTLLISQTFSKGKFDGPYKAYFDDGTLSQEFTYENELIQGEMKVYYANGKLKDVLTYRQGEEAGPFEEYYENGNIKTKGTYFTDEVEQGELLLYDSLGTLLETRNCKVTQVGEQTFSICKKVQ